MDSGRDTDQDTGQDRLTVSEAAARLGVTQDAVRKRIARHTIGCERGQDGKVYVLLKASKTEQDANQDTGKDTDQDSLIESLQDQVEYLREEMRRRDERHEEESRRKDHIIAALTQRIPELKAPNDMQEPREASKSPSAEKDHQEAEEESQKSSESPLSEKRSWWRRMFGG